MKQVKLGRLGKNSLINKFCIEVNRKQFKLGRLFGLLDVFKNKTRERNNLSYVEMVPRVQEPCVSKS